MRMCRTSILVTVVAVIFIGSTESFKSQLRNPKTRLFMSNTKCGHFNHVMVSKALGAFITASSILMPSIALADKPLNAPSAAGTRVNSDPESLLRYGLPVTTKELQDITSSIESVKANLRTRRLPFAQIDLKKAEERINKNGEKILTSMPASHKAAAQASLARLKQKISPVAEAITAELNAGQGSLQQQSYLDLANTEENNLSAELSTFAELLVPDDYKRDIPEEYKGLPVLQGRAEIEMVIKKPDNSKYDVDGKLYDQVKINMVRSLSQLPDSQWCRI